jgi:hypothetical protein
MAADRSVFVVETLLLSAPKRTIPASSKVRNGNIGRTAGVAGWTA